MTPNELRDLALSSANLWELSDGNRSSHCYSLVQVMGERGGQLACDVAATYEMLTLLAEMLDRSGALLQLTELVATSREGIYYSVEERTVLLAIDVPVGALSYVACWCVDSLISESIRQLPGLILVPFIIEADLQGRQTLFPEWWTVFCPHGQLQKGIPILALKSVLNTDGFEDWVEIANQRRHLFGIPV